MVYIVCKKTLPDPSDVPERLAQAAKQATSVALREPRPAGFPLLFTAQWQLIEPAVAFLHEHAVQRAHTTDTIRTYAEILYDWFETLEQNAIRWDKADAVDLVAYRNRMMQQSSPQTGRPYRVSTINHRVRGVLRFYKWAVRMHWLEASPLASKPESIGTTKRCRPDPKRSPHTDDDSFFLLRQYEQMPRPLMTEQACELLAALPQPYDLMARWQLYTGLRAHELLQLEVSDIPPQLETATSHHTIDVIRKGRKAGYVIASATLLDETAGYVRGHRQLWLQRARLKGRAFEHTALFINSRGAPAGKNAYQRVISKVGRACGFKATTHLLRATFACMLLARLEQLAHQGADINPLLIVKLLLGHERIETTDRYLRAIAVDGAALKDALESLLSGDSS